LKAFVRGAFEGERLLAPQVSREPVRDEFYAAERLREHARTIARAHVVSSRSNKGRTLAKRLAESRAALHRANLCIEKTVNDARPLTPAEVWLVDNYRLVQRWIHEIRMDLTPGYYRQLPKIRYGSFEGYPRVFAIAWDFIAHCDGRFDSEMAVLFFGAYQEVHPLTVGELWALSITLRIVLIEKLGRLARQISADRAESNVADGLADRLLAPCGQSAESVAIFLAAYERRRLSQSFAVQFFHRLADQDLVAMPALKWLADRLTMQGTTTEMVLSDVRREQSAMTVSVRNIITSLRLICELDSKQLVERLSLVDAILAGDCNFKRMDFPTRTLYRSAVEDLSRGSKFTELDIARAAVVAAKQTRDRSPTAERGRRGDVGYILLSGGRLAFEEAIGYRPPFRGRASLINPSVGVSGYIIAVSLVAAILLALPLLGLDATGASRAFLCLLLGRSPFPAALKGRLTRSASGPSANLGNGVVDISTSIPEPSTWAMMLLGFASLGFAGYRRARVA
jgi:cyclic beta-1,2-glucan synthetase